MKTSKILSVLVALLFSVIMGAVISPMVGIPAGWGAVGMAALSVGVSFVHLPQGMPRVGILLEAWTGQVVEHFTHAEEGTFLDGIQDFSQFADNDVIHLVDVAGDPTVLINNNTYPLAIENLDGDDVTISLAKFETLPTRITDDELYAVSYDKMGVTKTRHGNKLSEAMLDKALHAMAPAGHTAATPVVLTTGAADETGRLVCVRKDIISLRKACDAAKMPKKGRRLVLCNDHINDLLELDQKFKDQYHNYETGSIGKMYGFDVYEYATCPLFGQDKAKKSFGAVAGVGDYEASVVFYVPRMFKAKGTTIPYASEAKNDPVNKQNLLSFTTRFVVLPQKADGAVAALASKKSA